MSKAWDEKPPDHGWATGDSAPQIVEQLLDGNGDPVNLSGASITYRLVKANGDGTPVISRAATLLQVGDGSDGSRGKVGITPTVGETAAYGDHIELWRVTFSGGAIETFPLFEPARHKVRISTP